MSCSSSGCGSAGRWGSRVSDKNGVFEQRVGDKKIQGAPHSRMKAHSSLHLRKRKKTAFETFFSWERARRFDALDSDPMMRVRISFVALVALATIGCLLVPGENSAVSERFVMGIASHSNSWHRTCDRRPRLFGASCSLLFVRIRRYRHMSLIAASGSESGG